MSKNKFLRVTGASEHNLKNIDVTIPHNSLTVITGVSGSGKSSLAYNVIYNESRRRFFESFSTYARQYIGKMEKPNVKEITGLQAALVINQKAAVANPRSTVGTMSGIYDYLRLLYARLGEVHCTACAEVITKPGSTICGNCGTESPKVLSNLFSFNSKYGACPTCKGLSVTEQIDKNKLIADDTKTLAEGALVPTTPNGYIVYSQVRVDELNKVCEAHGFSVNIPWNKLTEEQQNVIWYGSNRVKILFGKHSLESRLKWKGITAKPREEAYYKGMIPIMDEILHRDRNDNILRFASSFVCNDCDGSRLRKEALAVTINSKNISELSEFSISDLNTYLIELSKTITGRDIYDNILNHVFNRLKYLELLGLGYLVLSRESTTISGGEAQRIRLASQVGSGLQGLLYILDEPSIGLHPRDNKKLLEVLKSLRNNGNTLLVVEHDEETIKAADYLIDIGPKAGLLGGNVTYQGATSYLFENREKFPNSATAQLIATDNTTVKAAHSARVGIGNINIVNASKHNLKNIDVSFKVGAFNVVTGVSGAGKSTLVYDVLSKGINNQNIEVKSSNVVSSVNIARVVEIDQSPIGRTPRSNPATYTDIFDHVRELFARLPESKKRGYKKGRFSFNNKGGRCEVCQGAGYIHLGMHFLGDVDIVCEQCNGKRFNNETLEIQYNGKNIYDILNMSIYDAEKFFEDVPRIAKIIDKLVKLDVGYLKLGQPSTTLSGGEAQRIKLASELYKTSKGHVLYILDEPTVGLHKADIGYLLNALNEIVENGNTVIVIEHDIDIIKQADYIIDLGPEGGESGGYVVAQGSLQDIINCKQSYTGAAILETMHNPISSTTTKSDILKKISNIKFTGITTNNLKNIDVEIPINKTTVITGISGSGKSSLAFDTIYSESRNRFTESLSTYARRMMNKVKKPELEQCSGLTAAIAIRQNRYKKNPRSTVGTVSEIYDLYRLLFSRVGITSDGKKANLPASMFSFNKVEAACEHCKGLGIITTSDPKKFITHPHLALAKGAMDGTVPGKFFGNLDGQYAATLLHVGNILGLDFNLPFTELLPEARKIAMFGTGDKQYNVKWKFKRGNHTGVHDLVTTWKGFVNYLNEDYEIKRKGSRGDAFKSIMLDVECSSCHGERLTQNVLEVKFNKLNISELSSKSISAAIEFFKDAMQINDTRLLISKNIIVNIISKLHALVDIGLGYLAINRATSTLSGGEAQRLRIATQLVADLCGLTYVLDEPTIGLHSRDTQKLMTAIDKLKKNGNTIILVEHDPDVIRMADNIIDLGIGAGENGGEIIAQGDLELILKNPNSITGNYLSKVNSSRNHALRKLSPGISITGARANNLKDIDVNIPKGGIIAITGVSGSGKSSLVFDVIANSYNANSAINCDSISFNSIGSVLVVDQHKIGTSPMSTPATYTGLFDLVRELFAKLDDARSLKYKKSTFSFNSADGHCPTCKGMGMVKVSMDFLSDMWVNCDTCNGKRYKESILKIKYNGYSIYDVLNLEVRNALDVFRGNRKIENILQTLVDIGLGYLKLGQATSTLSGGETQRLKLVNVLIKTSADNCLYIFDEPSAGLHMQDVEKLISVFNNLVDTGNTVLVVEHNLDIIDASDYVIELGPEGGVYGGEIISAKANNPNQYSPST